jgi:IK cytokine
MPETEAFSNPLAPPGGEHYGDNSASHPLTNEDFRKLMMTPRVPSGATSSSSTSAPVPVFAKPKVPEKIDPNDPGSARKQKKSYYAQLKKEEEQREKELAQKYRDRARERRDGVNKDYDEQGDLPSTTADYRAVAPDAKIGEDYAERRKMVIQESKYLGGDMEHTHLVKGLDYALLEKVKAEISSKEIEEEELETVLKQKPEKKDEEPEEQMNFKTKLGRNIFRQLFSRKLPERNELFLPGRMAYVVDLEDDMMDSDIPTTLIRSKADCPSLESTTTLTNNDIVINKLTQILSYLRQGRRDKKKRKDRGKVKEDEKLKVDDSIYTTEALTAGLRDERSDRNQGHDRRDRIDRDRTSDKTDRKKSYFEKPVEDDERNVELKLPTSAKELVKSINERFSKNWGSAELAESMDKKPAKDDKVISRLKSKTEIDSYAECYPGMAESADAIDDSDDEVDYTKMDQGNKKGPVGRWDFDTQEEYSNYMSSKEALPKAAFQYGVKMADGRKTRRTGPKDEKKELDREWQKIQNIIAKRKVTDGGSSGATSPKVAKY